MGCAMQYHTLREIANGVYDDYGRFYPFRVKYFDTDAQTLPALPNQFIYVKRCVISYTRVAGDLGTYAGAFGIQDGQACSFGYISAAGGLNSFGSIAIDVNCSMDAGEAVTADAPNITDFAIVITYALIDEISGQFRG